MKTTKPKRNHPWRENYFGFNHEKTCRLCGQAYHVARLRKLRDRNDPTLCLDCDTKERGSA